MVYGNNDPMAVSAMEAAHYGDYDEAQPIYRECPECGYKTKYCDFRKLYRKDGEIIGCNLCMDEIDEYGEEYVA